MIENLSIRDETGIHCVSTEHGGRPLLMLHGVTRRWQSFVPIIGSLATRRQVHAMDFRGHGLSDRSTQAYRVLDYIENVNKTINALTNEPVVLYGHSLGAMVAAALAALRPGHVAAIIMEDPPMHAMGEEIVDSDLHGFFSALKPFAGSESPTASIARELADVRLRNSNAGREVRLGDLRDEPSLRFTAACLKQLDHGIFDPILEGRWLEGFDINHTFSNVACPALLIQADTAAGGMLSNDDAATIKRLAHDVTHVKLEGCGHLAHWSRTDELLGYVHAFLESLE